MSKPGNLTNQHVPECADDTTIIGDEYDEYDEDVFKMVYFSGCIVKPANSRQD